MSIAAAVLAASAAFLAAATGVYWVMSSEHAGTVMLGGCVPALLLLAVWLRRATRGRTLPEDSADATSADGAGEVGYFPASSIWPLVLATGMVVAANALAFGVWLAATGGLLIALGIVGYAVEASSKA